MHPERFGLKPEKINMYTLDYTEMLVVQEHAPQQPTNKKRHPNNTQKHVRN